MAASLAFAPAAAEAACAITSPQKFGVGGFPVSGARQMDSDLAQLSTRWYYDWGPSPSGSTSGYVPMIWSWQYMNYANNAPGKTLLTFNEPDNRQQANMSVAQALAYWPNLMATGKRLGSPAVQTGNELGSKWLGQFMAQAKQKNYRVDFVAVHYYTTNRSVSAFKYYLQNIYNAYKKPIWVTEWALADWTQPGRFTAAQQATFFTQGVEMMDDLWFVEKHAWFGIYDGMDGWNLRSGLIYRGKRTVVGNSYLAEVSC